MIAMFETIAIGNLGADPKPKRVNLPSGDVANVVELIIYFNDLKAVVPKENGEKMEKKVLSKISVWDEKDQKWLLEKAKKGSRLQISGTPKLGVFFNQNKNHWDVALEFRNPDKIKFRSFGSNGTASPEMTGKSASEPYEKTQSTQPKTEQKQETQPDPVSPVGQMEDLTDEQSKKYQQLFNGLNNAFQKEKPTA